MDGTNNIQVTKLKASTYRNGNQTLLRIFLVEIFWVVTSYGKVVRIPVFQRSMLTPSSGWSGWGMGENGVAIGPNHSVCASCWLVAPAAPHQSGHVSMLCSVIPVTSPWRWRQHGTMKWWYPTTSVHSITTQKTLTWNITVEVWQLSSVAISTKHPAVW